MNIPGVQEGEKYGNALNVRQPIGIRKKMLLNKQYYVCKKCGGIESLSEYVPHYHKHKEELHDLIKVDSYKKAKGLLKGWFGIKTKGFGV